MPLYASGRPVRYPVLIGALVARVPGTEPTAGVFLYGAPHGGGHATSASTALPSDVHALAAALAKDCPDFDIENCKFGAFAQAAGTARVALRLAERGAHAG